MNISDEQARHFYVGVPLGNKRHLSKPTYQSVGLDKRA